MLNARLEGDTTCTLCGRLFIVRAPAVPDWRVLLDLAIEAPVRRCGYHPDLSRNYGYVLEVAPCARCGAYGCMLETDEDEIACEQRAGSNVDGLR